MEGNEVRKILLQNDVNLTWLAEQLGISPQGLNSRLNAKEFKHSYLIELTHILGQDYFGVLSDFKDTRQKILDIRVCAGNGIGLEGDENKVIEYVSIPALSGCVGLTVYGESMYPLYKPGDTIFVKLITDRIDIDFGHTYLVITRSDRLLKMLYQSDKGDDYIRLCSYNADTKPDGERLYPDRDIHVENIIWIYKVVGSLQREQM